MLRMWKYSCIKEQLRPRPHLYGISDYILISLRFDLSVTLIFLAHAPEIQTIVTTGLVMCG